MNVYEREGGRKTDLLYCILCCYFMAAGSNLTEHIAIISRPGGDVCSAQTIYFQ